MEKFKKILKNNRYTVIAIVLFAVLVVIGLILSKSLFPNSGAPVYGNRLDGIEEVKISNENLKELESKIKEKEFVTEVNATIKGKIVNVIITVKKETNANDAKALSSIMTDYFPKEQTDYYDFQIFIKNEDGEQGGYPIIGYKNNGSSAFSYSNAK